MEARKITFQLLKIIWAGIFVSVLVFSLLAAYFAQTGLQGLSSEKNILIAALAFITLASSAAGYIISGKKITAIAPGLPVEEKMSAFTAALIIRLACFEGPALFANVVVFLTGDSAALVIAGLMLLLIIMNFPSATKTGQLLNLTEDELSRLLKGDSAGS